jgi:MFS family permease
MSVTAGERRPASSLSSWRTPLVIIACGCAIALLGFGPRSTLGFFIQPMSRQFSWGRDVFGLALAVQNLLWGLGQPFAGAIADRFGILRVMFVGALLYAAGLLMMRYATTPLSLDLGAGVLIGFGLSGCSFNLVLSAFSKLLPAERRGLALGAGTAAGSFGQFLFAPIGVALIGTIGWQGTLTVFAALMLLIVPLALALSTPPAPSASVAAADQQSFKTALAEAFGHRSYVLLVLGFFTCGFQLAFITIHLPAFLVDRGISAQTGGWVVAAIGFFNIIGSISVGWLQNRLPKRYILSTIPHPRACYGGFHLAADHAGLGNPVRRYLGPDLALHGAADVGAGSADVRHALVCDALWFCVRQPPGRRLPRGLARRHRVRTVRFLRAGVGAVRAVRRFVCADQSAHRRKACCAHGCASRLIR